MQHQKTMMMTTTTRTVQLRMPRERVCGETLGTRRMRGALLRRPPHLRVYLQKAALGTMTAAEGRGSELIVVEMMELWVV